MRCSADAIAANTQHSQLYTHDTFTLSPVNVLFLRLKKSSLTSFFHHHIHLFIPPHLSRRDALVTVPTAPHPTLKCAAASDTRHSSAPLHSTPLPLFFSPLMLSTNCVLVRAGGFFTGMSCRSGQHMGLFHKPCSERDPVTPLRTPAAASRFVPLVGGKLLSGEGAVVPNLK